MGTKYSTMDQVKFFKGSLPQILLGPFLNILSHIFPTEIHGHEDPFENNKTASKFQNALLQGCQKLNKYISLQVKWKSNKNLKAIETIFLMTIYNGKFRQP